MWSSEEEFKRQTKRETELNLSFRYLSPHSFTVLRPENQVPPAKLQIPLPNLSPPENKHRLTPTIKRKRNTSFAIIADVVSNPASRSPSPLSGRVSPFRGHGFNPAGSRHASPLPSPTVQKKLIHFESASSSTPENKPPRPELHGVSSSKGSKIPTLTRRDSIVAGEKKYKDESNLSKQLSQSLSNISPRTVSYKPPPSPHKYKHQKPAAFEKLSPIVGSSPEPSPSQRSLLKQQSMSSPSKIPRSRSQPPSSRTFQNPNSRVSSRSSSRNVSRNTSRESSPNKLSASKSNYGNVKAKVDSYNAIKYKVPPKPQVPTNQKPKTGSGKKTPSNNNGDSSTINKEENKTRRAETKTKEGIKTVKEEERQKTTNQDNRRAEESYSSQRRKEESPHSSQKRREEEPYSSQKRKEESPYSSHKRREEVPYSSQKRREADEIRNATQESNVTREIAQTKNEPVERKGNENVSKPHDSLPSTTAVVSSTTTTVTQPLKIEAKMDVPSLKEDMDKNDDSVYLPDGRALSATSVSTALNRMNNTVIDSKTLMQETTLPLKLHSSSPSNLSLSNKSGTNFISSTNTANRNGTNVSANSLHEDNNKTTDPTQKTNAKTGVNERTVIGISVLPKTASDEIKMNKPVTNTHVEPIRIMVQEKPINGDVQSGNVRFPPNVINGSAERPGLPPPQQPQEETPNTDAPQNVCSRLFGCCKKSETDENKKTSKLWCFKRKEEKEALPVDDQADNKKWYPKLNCRKSSVTPASKTERKESWIESAEEIAVEEKRSLKDSCKNFFSTLFCLKFCKRRQKVADIVRKPSIMSKKKSLTPSIPIEEPKPKLDASLIEHMSLMKGAIPVLSVPLAWLCLILNVFLPGTGTIVSGFICMCTGKPRFSANDGMKQRFGACVIDFFIGCGQLFTVLFCLVGWGWSIWWGVIMIKVARKYRKIRNIEKAMEDDRKLEETTTNAHNVTRDPERGS